MILTASALDPRPAWRTLAATFGLVFATATFGSGAARAGDNIHGGWSNLVVWPVIPIHAMVLPTGTVMSLGSNGDGKQTGHLIYDIWDPKQHPVGSALTTAGHLTLPNTTQTDLFCSAQILLPTNNDVFLSGGDTWNGTATTGASNNDTVTFDPDTNKLTPGPDMSRARWYATLTTLPNGEIYIQGGRQKTSQGGAQGVDLAEVRATNGSLRALTGMSTAALPWWYPNNWVAPDGRIFGYSYRKMYYVEPAGIGKLTMAGAMPKDGPEGVTSSAAMFAKGKILRTGGGEYKAIGSNPGRTAAVVIDINGATPKITKTQDMPVGLHWHNATVVPDGKVIVTGGSALADYLVGVNDRAYIWDPATGQWTEGAQTNSGKARMYHSIGLLLPDASILVGGGGAGGNNLQINTNAEIYYPPYLYDSSGAFAKRPKIVSGATVLKYKGTHNIKVDNGASDHACDPDQDRCRDPQRQHGAAVSPALVRGGPDGRQPAQGEGPAERQPGHARPVLFVRPQRAGVPSVARMVSIAPPV